MCAQLHVCKCGYPPFCVKRTVSGPLTSHHVSVQSVQPFPRYGKGVRTCTCTPPLTFVKRQANASLTTNRISAQSVRPFPRFGKGAHLHVRHCARPLNHVRTRIARCARSLVNQTCLVRCVVKQRFVEDHEETTIFLCA